MTVSLLPPGRAESVKATSVLVVAPHYDDEVLGCGGLLRQLANDGAAVRILFLSDSRGGEELVEEADVYRARRREEAEGAVQVLGAVGFDDVGLPDGGLEHHLEEIGAAVRVSLLSLRPDLLLVPSPLEVTADHRSAFAAVADLLAGVRPGSELAPVVDGLVVLLYEVNHPGYPDLLVDVTAEVGAIEEAMGHYVSQQERHDYLGVALALRRYRTLSLPPTVESAEGYRRLTIGDFTTRSQSRLVRDLGGVQPVVEIDQGPLVSVVVRTCDRPALLAEALESIAASTYRRLEVVLVDDGEHEVDLPRAFPFPLERIDCGPRQGRAAAANRGVAAARGDYVTFLDDDDLVEPEHFAVLAKLVGAAGVRVAYTDAAVGVYELDGDRGWRQIERRLPYSRDFDSELLLVDNYIPLNTLIVERVLFDDAGPFDEELTFFEDWDLLVRLAALSPFYHLARVTCEYRHFRGGGHILGECPRERPDFVAMKERVVAKHFDRLDPGALARVVDQLRAEEVEAAERARSASSRLLAIEGDYHAQRGALAALQEERAAIVADMRGLDEHLGRTYNEIERLNGLLETMRSTRAWRLHEWLEKRRR